MMPYFEQILEYASWVASSCIEQFDKSPKSKTILAKFSEYLAFKKSEKEALDFMNNITQLINVNFGKEENIQVRKTLNTEAFEF